VVGRFLKSGPDLVCGGFGLSERDDDAELAARRSISALEASFP
jgi:hypothetical protein